jgi:DNA (cytosine-5)-methyltransferase 1
MYFNEIDGSAAQWLRNLCGNDFDVDERSIVDVHSTDLMAYDRCHFFAGIGGWELALRLAGWPDDQPVWTGSCPCQPFSVAGKGRGADDERHLWPQFRRLIDECRPAVIFGEQVASKAGRVWLDGVRVELEALGYAVGAADLCAAGIGAPHIRQRLFWVAYAQHGTGRAEHVDDTGERQAGEPLDGTMSGSDREGTQRLPDAHTPRKGWRGIQRPSESDAENSIEPSDEPAGRSGGDEFGGMVDLQHTGPQGLGRHGDGGSQSRRLAANPDGSTSPPGVWDEFGIATCRDTDRDGQPKLRSVPLPESGIQPLAYGIPRGMGSEFTRLSGVAGNTGRASSRNRTTRLKGYGNAIVPQLAAVFIQSFMDVCEEFVD